MPTTARVRRPRKSIPRPPELGQLDPARVCGAEDPSSHELGPAVLRPDGLYSTQAPPFTMPSTAPARTPGPRRPALAAPWISPMGRARSCLTERTLLDTSPGVYGAGTRFFEWMAPPSTRCAGARECRHHSSYYGNMVVLPPGRSSSPTSHRTSRSTRPWAALAPAVLLPSFPWSSLTHGTHNNVITGTQFSGKSQGAAYGDDSQNATNFPRGTDHGVDRESGLLPDAQLQLGRIDGNKSCVRTVRHSLHNRPRVPVHSRS